jgi:hypothetical protein
MAKNKDVDVRLHSQEREWLRNLGGGDLVEGVQNLIRQLLERDDDKYYDYPDHREKRGFFGRWRRD